MTLLIHGYSHRTSGSATPFGQFHHEIESVETMAGKEIHLPEGLGEIGVVGITPSEIILCHEVRGNKTTLNIAPNHPTSWIIEQNIVAITFHYELK